MNICEPAIRRPVGTTLLAIGLMLVGIVAYRFLPVASMPTVDFPTISVSVNGAEQPAIRVRVNPIALASMGLNMEDVRTAIANSNAVGPLGVFDGEGRAITIAANDQLRAASQYDPLVVRVANGTVVRLSAIASIEPGVRNSRSFGWFNRQPSVLLVITKAANSNVIETV